MAERLSIQIGLEGSREVERQLISLGKTGQQAFNAISKAAEQVGGFDKLDPTTVTKKLEELGITGEEAINKINRAVQDTAQFQQLAATIGSMEKQFAEFGEAGAKAFGKISDAMKELGSAQIEGMNINIDQSTGLLSKMADAAIVAGRGLVDMGKAAAAFVRTPMGAALVAIGGSMLSLAEITIKTAKSFVDLNAEAMKLQLPIEDFDRLRRGFQAAGISSQAITSGLEKMKGAMDDLKVKEVNAAFETLQKNLQRGFGIQGTEQLRQLQEAATGAGKAGETAREKLKQLGEPIPDAAAQKIQAIIEAAGGLEAAMPAVIEAFRQMPDSADRSAIALQTLGNALGTELIQALRTGGVELDQFRQRMGGVTQESVNTASQLTQETEKMRAALERFSSVAFAPLLIQGVQMVTAALEGLANFIDTKLTWDNFLQSAQMTWQQIKDAAELTMRQIAEFVTTPVANAWQWIVDMWNAAMAKLGFGGGGGGGGGEKFASGGRVGGHGTGTSDSNLAWVSRGEHIMPARAVSQPGVLAFLEALRRSGGNLRRVLDGMGRFNLGGLVPRPMSFAGGGLAGGMSNVTIQFPGLPAVGGLRASADVVEELRRSAAMAQVRSGGRKPSRYT